jgi:hypothetical protein
MRHAPLWKSLSLANGIGDLIEPVLGRLADKVRVGEQRVVCFPFETHPMSDELLSAGSRLDQQHDPSEETTRGQAIRLAPTAVAR